MKQEVIQKIVSYINLFLVLLFIITGYGITRYQIVEALSLGLLTKVSSFKIHELLIYPLIPALTIHVYLSAKAFKKKR